MTILKRIKLIIIYILAQNLSDMSSVYANSNPEKSHIIFIMADDLGYNDVGFLGNDVLSTPNLDALAYSGVILKNYYVQPICTPSRGAFLTGMYPIHTGLQHFVIRAAEPFGLPLNFPVFPQYLKGLGYTTRIVGKWHLGNFRKGYTPTFRGFDSHYGYWTGVIDYFNYTDAFDADGLSGYDFRRDMNVEYPEIGTYVTDLFAEESVKIINEHDPSKSLFLFVSHLASHVGNPGSRLQAPEEDIQRFSYIQDKERRIYAAMIWKLDESVGRVIKALEDNNMLQNSIIVFTTDNGGVAGGFIESASSNWPLRGSKLTTWEGGIRGAAFVWSPLLNNPGRVSTEMMHITDWFPSLYHAAGGSLSFLPKMDGLNVWESIKGEAISPRNEILVNIDPVSNGGTIRIGDWKLIYNPVDLFEEAFNFNGWFGPIERNSFSNEYSSMNLFQDVINSPAGKIVQKVTPNIFKKIRSIREDTQVLCDEVPENATATCYDPSNPCLFNIAKDPCEYYDVSESYPELVELLLSRLRFFNKTMIPPENKPADPRANPIFWNNTWTNWFDYLDESSFNFAY